MKMPTLDQFRSNRSVLFWTLHAAGWAAYGISQYFGALLYEKPSSYARVIAASAIAGFVLSAPMRFIYRRLWNRRLWEQAPRTMIVWVLASCYVTGAGAAHRHQHVVQGVRRPGVARARRCSSCSAARCPRPTCCCAGALLYFGIKFYESQRQQEQAMLKAVSLAQEAQLKMLRYQLNPHFLFNTLNAISTLILDNQNRKANHAVTRLSEFLRYTLDQDPMKKVTLRQEIEALDLYLGTERLRFGERLRLEYAIEEPALEALVPSLLLQPLLENSLKYAVSAARAGRHGAHRGPHPRGAAGAVASSTTARACARARACSPASGAASGCATRASASRCCTATTAASRCSTRTPGCGSRWRCRWRPRRPAPRAVRARCRGCGVRTHEDPHHHRR